MHFKNGATHPQSLRPKSFCTMYHDLLSCIVPNMCSTFSHVQMIGYSSVVTTLTHRMIADLRSRNNAEAFQGLTAHAHTHF